MDSDNEEKDTIEDITQKRTRSFTIKNLNSTIVISLSILTAGLMIAGAIVFNGKLLTNIQSGSNSSSSGASTTSSTVNLSQFESNIVSLAGSLGMNESKFKTCYDKNTYNSEIQAEITAGNNLGVSGTPTVLIGMINSKNNTVTGRIVTGAVPLTVFTPLIDNYVKYGSTNGYSNQYVSTTDLTVTLPSRVTGNSNSKVAFVEYGDFECPYCEQLYQQVIPSIMDSYVNNGKIQFAFSDFPLTSIHPYALSAAIGGECAQEQGKFWEYYNNVYGSDYNKLFNS